MNIVLKFICVSLSFTGIITAAADDTEDSSCSSSIMSMFHEASSSVLSPLLPADQKAPSDIKKRKASAKPESLEVVQELSIADLEKQAIKVFLRLSEKKEERSPERLPAYLRPHFHGISVQDLIKRKRVPPINPEDQFNYTSIDLSGLHLISIRGLESIPGIARVRSIDLSKNLLTGATFESDIFTTSVFKVLGNLCSLNLGRNPLGKISLTMLRDLGGLFDLNVSRCQLEDIPSDPFMHLKELKNLDLSFNKLRILKTGIFRGLHEVQNLYLNNNNISDFETYTFSPFSGLNCCNIYDNPLTSNESVLKKLVHELGAANYFAPRIYITKDRCIYGPESEIITDAQ